MITHTLSPQSADYTSFPGSARSLSYYLLCGQDYRQQQENLTPDDFKEIREKEGKSFIDLCLKLLKQWENLDDCLQSSILAIQFPKYLSAAAAVALLKVPLDGLKNCLSQLNEFIQKQGALTSTDISKIAQLFHIKPKRYLILGEVASNNDWEFTVKKLKLKDSEQIKSLKEQAQTLATVEVLTDHIVQASDILGYDIAKLLPKPKKQFTQKDLDLATEQLTRENATLKSEKEALFLRLQFLEVQSTPKLTTEPQIEILEQSETTESVDTLEKQSTLEQFNDDEVPNKEDLSSSSLLPSFIPGMTVKVQNTNLIGKIKRKSPSGWIVKLQNGLSKIFQPEQLDVISQPSQKKNSLSKSKGFGLSPHPA
ncbi:hypothetical protein C7H19_22305 [Aphanothece hegewaldii CCALA 016]|uniref:Uncharacterized protein n=1 Tax=Aphanothece hegewaldii CCALA 016 TaxID=2107694 RepID=A0A2T1LS23_9CHRO|nr:hypothetical protein [Aphanothece hegewaldii]PSF31760.1 hypothetical protein C7H19_22305 [Aphanothece hegewaldii CCALA 016]